MRPDYAELPRVFDLSRPSYYLDFALAPLMSAALIAVALYAGAYKALLFGLPLGILLWEIAEYGIHRFLFHDVAYFRRMHDVHHAHPRDLVGIASYGTLVAFGSVWLALALLSGWWIAHAVTAGTLLGYLFYIAIHDRMHHGDRARFGRYMRFMFSHHVGHHRGGHANFGVSSPVFDLIFRTYRLSA